MPARASSGVPPASDRWSSFDISSRSCASSASSWPSRRTGAPAISRLTGRGSANTARSSAPAAAGGTISVNCAMRSSKPRGRRKPYSPVRRRHTPARRPPPGHGPRAAPVPRPPGAGALSFLSGRTAAVTLRREGGADSQRTHRTAQGAVIPMGEPSGMTTIEVRGLTKRYGPQTVVDDLSFTVEPGHVTGFLGPNGAGKSTTMRMILGLTPPTSGSVRVGGREYGRLPVPLTERTVEDTAAAVASGDLGRRVPEPAPPGTEIGRLSGALNTMLGQLERAFAERAASEARMREFVSDGSHELRTPLFGIKGSTELYRMGALTGPDDVDATMHRIEREAARLTALTEDLLLLARLDQAPGAALEPAPMDLRTLAGDARHDLRALDRS